MATAALFDDTEDLLDIRKDNIFKLSDMGRGKPGTPADCLGATAGDVPIRPDGQISRIVQKGTAGDRWATVFQPRENRLPPLPYL